ncbi:MAG TPA: CARDB domain-containing protein [Solirubrobacterales bacterium]
MNRTRVASLAPVLLSLLVAAPAASAKTVAALPDLVVKKVSKPPATKTVGSKLRMVVQVRNVGVAKAGKSKLGLYLGKGKKHTKKDKRLKRVKVKPLAAGKTKKLKLRVVLPAKTKAGSYRLFACADDTKKVKEEKERNCKATRKIRLLPKAPPPAPTPPPAPAFTMTDGIDWGFVENAQEETPKAGSPVTLTLTAGNGIPGQAGYARASVPSEGFRGGNTTVLDFGSDLDDNQVTRQLPFAFPFGGVREQSISISTNGWASFGAPAWDYWDDNQPSDYRGIQAVVGEFYRGLMPYWADLDVADLGAGPGSVKEVVAPDLSWVAYQWDLGTHDADGLPRRSFQLVLFPDGRFRFDYPGDNAAGGQKSLTGYSLGTGAAGADIVSAEGNAVPPSGILFTPNALPATGATAPGQVTAVLPKGSSLLSASPGCALTAAPAQFTTGLVSCPVAGLAPGAQVSHAVTFATPPNAPGQSSPANFRLLGAYLSGGLNLADRNEIDTLTTDLEPTTLNISPEYTGGNIEAGVPTTFEVTIGSTSSGLDEPSATFDITNATISAVEIAGQPIECTALGGASTTCQLPSGISSTKVKLTVVPTTVNPLELTTTARALNAPEQFLKIGIFP